MAWAAAVAAPFVTHLAIADHRLDGLAPVLAAAEIAALAAVTLRRLRGPARWAGLAVAAALLGLLAMRLPWLGGAGPGLVAAAAASHALIYGSLLILFVGSLRRGRTDLVTGLARRLRGVLTPEMLAYTRGVNKAWCCFFAGQLAVSAALLALAPLEAWSLFVNVLDGPLVVLMFASEFAIRTMRFRGYHHISPLETFRSYARDRAAKP